MVRTIQAPGIELQEIDRSGYEQKTDNSIVGTTSLLMGFADTGVDYSIQNINSMNTFVNVYGNPKNEAERYFYNGAYEILNRGGRLYTAKLPYDNNSLDKFPFTTYTIDDHITPLSSPYDVMTSISATTETGRISVSLYEFLLMPNVHFNDVVYILIDAGVLPPQIDPEELLQTEYAENTYIIDEDDDDSEKKVDFCEYYTKSGISLSIVCDMMDYTLDVSNVKYYTYEVIDEVFRIKNQSSRLYGYYKNDSMYLIRDLMNDLSSFKEKHLAEVPSEKRESYSNQLDQIYERLVEYGTFDEIIQTFGKSRKIQYYRDYFYSLSSEVEKNGLRGTGPTDPNWDTYRDLMYVLAAYNNKELLYKKYTDIKQFDEYIDSYIGISSTTQDKKNSGMMDMETFDKLLVRDQIAEPNKIIIVDIARNKYVADEYRGDKLEYIGILPVITTAVNAMVYQKIITCSQDEISDYVSVKGMQNSFSSLSSNMIDGLSNDPTVISKKRIAGFTQSFGSESNVSDSEETVSKSAEKLFPQIKFNMNGLEFQNLKKIGVVLFKMYIDTSNELKTSFIPVESFVGSLNKNDIDQNTNASTFIDNVVNNNSNYIRLFSNLKFQEDLSKPELYTDKAKTFVINMQNSTSLGLYESDCDKKISIKVSINQSIDKIFDSLKDPNRYRIDIVVDGGVSNIAQFVSLIDRNTEKAYYDILQETAYIFQSEYYRPTKAWVNVLTKYDNFCKYTRKDCMFIADGLRSICLNGNEKRVRNTKPTNTIENTVLADIKYMSGYLNSSYGAGYCDWFKCLDHASGDYFWCPPSIKAAGIYTYTDAYSNFWMAPAGLARGKLPSDVIDCAFSPTIDQAGSVYINNWNYAVNYPIDGIVMEGQRTFQKNKTAMDRVNVRRLCLGVEKIIKYIAKFYNYEQNTTWLRSRFKDSISNYLEQVKTGSGIKEYVVICDDRNNTTQTIENNELHLTVAIKPIKSVEFIICQFVCTNQSANVMEIAESEM